MTQTRDCNVNEKGNEKAMKFNGLSAEQVEQSRRQHGSNSLTQIPPDPLWQNL